MKAIIVSERLITVIQKTEIKEKVIKTEELTVLVFLLLIYLSFATAVTPFNSRSLSFFVCLKE